VSPTPYLCIGSPLCKGMVCGHTGQVAPMRLRQRKQRSTLLISVEIERRDGVVFVLFLREETIGKT
jgi:hypothetical protein